MDNSVWRVDRWFIEVKVKNAREEKKKTWNVCISLSNIKNEIVCKTGDFRKKMTRIFFFCLKIKMLCHAEEFSSVVLIALKW